MSAKRGDHQLINALRRYQSEAALLLVSQSATLEVFAKPSDAGTRFQVCFVGTPNYACTNQSPIYTAPGLYTWATDFTQFYQYNQVDWSRGARQVSFILKDTMNGKPSPENVGATRSALYMPTSVRVTVTLVAPGSTYIPPSSADGGSTGSDGGRTGVPDSGMASVDAGTSTGVDAGTSTGVDAGTDAGITDAASKTQEPTDGGRDSTRAPDSARGGCGATGLWVCLWLAVLVTSRRAIPLRRAGGHARGI